MLEGAWMRASSLCLAIAALGIFSSPALAESAVASAVAVANADVHAACRIPFEKLKDPKTGEFFPQSGALNENANLSHNLRQRYIVADLNSADENGKCRGVEEHFTPVGELSEFPRLQAIAATRNMDVVALAKESPESLLFYEEMPGDSAGLAIELEDLQNYLQSVDRYKTKPVVKPAVFNGYCVGQTLSLCEIVDGEPTLVYRFVTSSAKWVPPVNRYYAPINVIKSRNWSSDRRYMPADARRDARMGGGDPRIVPFANDGNPIEMPNFLHFLPDAGYVGETANGIHEIAGGLDSGGTFGAPVSLGCIRLNKFQSKLVRWWIPRQAKFFIYLDPNRYRTFGIASNGRARGFQGPRDAETDSVPVATSPTYGTAPTAQRNRSLKFDLFSWASRAF